MSPLNKQITDKLTKDDPLIEALMGLVEDYQKDYEFPRHWLLREIRRNDLYYMDIQDIWISDDRTDWVGFSDAGTLGVNSDGNKNFEDFNFKFINIYSAFADSLIAALSTSIPATRFLPEDADDIQDVLTAEAYGKLTELNRKNNKAKLLLIKLLALLYNHGAVCVYNYADRDPKYGVVEQPVRGLIKRALVKTICSSCGDSLGEEVLPAEAVADDYEINGDTAIGETEVACPNCGINVIPLLETSEDTQQGIVDYSDVAKLRVIQKAYGLTNCSFAPYVAEQAQIPVFTFSHEEDISLVESIYSHLKGEIEETNQDTPEEEKWVRQNPLYYGELPKHTCTVKEHWIRPWAFNRIADDQYLLDLVRPQIPEGVEGFVPEMDMEQPVSDEPTNELDVEANMVAENEQPAEQLLSEYLQEKYPTGLRLVVVNQNHYAEHHEENFDDAWTISICPTQQWLVAKAAGSKMIPIQDAENDTFNLTLDTIEHGVPENFIDQSIIDFNRYSNVENRPGNTFPVNSSSIRSVADHFHQTKPASLSGEVSEFEEKIQARGQFVSGAQPSIYGAMDAETAAQDSMSRNQALQRLLLVWASVCQLWSEMECKSVKLYAKHLNYDEKFVKPEGTSAKNVWIRQVELQGKIADVEPEASESMPLTWGQKSDLMFKLIGLNNEFINEVLGDSENVSKVAKYIGSDELYIPGNDQRNKQLMENKQLSMVPPEAVELLLQTNQPTVQIEPDLDDHEIHSKTVKAVLISATGQALKRDQPAVYLNMLLHKKMHDAALAQQVMAEMEMQAKMSGEGDKGGKNVQPLQKPN